MSALIKAKDAWQFEKDWQKAQRPIYEIDVQKLNALILDWTLCAKEISGHCRHKFAGECLANCRGLMICQIKGLRIIEH